jgi:hypothetical protein
MPHRPFRGSLSPLTRLRRAALALLVSACVLPSSLSGQTVTRDQVMWTAGALQRVLSERDYPAVLAVAALNRGAGRGETGGIQGADILIAALGGGGGDGALSRCRGLRDPVEGTLCSMEALTPLLPPSLARDLAGEGARLVGLYHRPGEPTPQGLTGPGGATRFGGEGVLLAPLQGFAEQVLEEAWRRRDQGLPDPAHTNGPAVFASLLAGAVGLSPGESAEELLSRVPELRSLAARHPTLAALGGTARDGEAVLLEYRDFLASLTGSSRQLLEEASGVEAQLRGVREWATQRSFVYLSSRTAALTGLEAGVTERIRSLGNVAADLQREGSAFTANLAGMGRQAATAALRGDVFALAAGVASFFQLTPGALGPSAAEDVKALRVGVEALRDEMGVRFDDVDGRLDEVLDVLDTRFARMETLVASNHREVQEDLLSLQIGLSALGRRMDRMESNLAAYMQAGFDRDFSRTLIRCLEHRERHLPPFDQMEFPVFSGCLTDFRARGARDATDALLTDRTTGVDDPSLAEALADLGPENLARRVPLLARAAEQRFGYGGMQGGRGGANAEEWTVASQAYLTMLQDWPELALSVGPGDLEALLAVGVDLRQILRGILVDPATGERGALLQRVLSQYEARVAELTAEADVLARRHQQAQLRRVDPATLLTRITPSEEGRPELTAPLQVTRTFPQELRTATVLALEEPALVYTTHTADSVSRENFRRGGLFRRTRHDRLTWTRTRVELELRLRDGRVVSRHALAGTPVLTRQEEMGGGEGSENVRGVRSSVPDPVGHFLAEVWPTLSRQGGSWEEIPPDPRLLESLGAAVEGELRRNESTALNGVFSAVCQEGAGVAGVDGPDRESALRIRQAMDGLTTTRALLGAYVRLALPAAASSDVLLRELLYTPEGLLDRGALCRTVAAGESPLKVVWLDEEPRRRASELSGLMSAAMEREEASVDTATPVESTVRQLQSALRIQQLRARLARGAN